MRTSRSSMFIPAVSIGGAMRTCTVTGEITRLPFFIAARELARFLKRVESFRIPVLASIAPLESLRHTEFLANEVPGVRVPDAVVERMRRAEIAGHAAAEGLAIAREIAADVRPLVQGVEISTAGGSIESALGVMEAVY